MTSSYLPSVEGRVLAAELERLRERCEGYKGQVLTGSIEIERLRARVAELVAALQECADDLEQELEHHYAGTKDYPSERRRYERDTAPVRKARAAIAKAKGGPVR